MMSRMLSRTHTMPVANRARAAARVGRESGLIAPIQRPTAQSSRLTNPRTATSGISCRVP